MSEPMTVAVAVPAAPTRGQFRTATEVIVHVARDARPDAEGRVLFFASWITDRNEATNGVMQRAFKVDLDRFAAAHANRREPSQRQPVRIVRFNPGRVTT